MFKVTLTLFFANAYLGLAGANGNRPSSPTEVPPAGRLSASSQPSLTPRWSWPIWVRRSTRTCLRSMPSCRRQKQLGRVGVRHHDHHRNAHDLLVISSSSPSSSSSASSSPPSSSSLWSYTACPPESCNGSSSYVYTCVKAFRTIRAASSYFTTAVYFKHSAKRRKKQPQTGRCGAGEYAPLAGPRHHWIHLQARSVAWSHSWLLVMASPRYTAGSLEVECNPQP